MAQQLFQNPIPDMEILWELFEQHTIEYTAGQKV